MKYRVEYLPQVVKTLEKMDKYTKRIIVEWIEKHLVDCEDPRAHGKPLAANRVGQWRYRIGDYRVIARIEDNKLVILVIAIGHRREVYGGQRYPSSSEKRAKKLYASFGFIEYPESYEEEEEMPTYLKL